MIKKILVLLAMVTLIFPTNVRANELLNIKATAYCHNSGHTASGTVPMEGRTLAGKREWFGKTALVLEDKGNGIEPENFIGCFQVEDIGGDPIKKGYVVDVFIEDYVSAKEFGCKDVFIYLIDAEG